MQLNLCLRLVCPLFGSHGTQQSLSVCLLEWRTMEASSTKSINWAAVSSVHPALNATQRMPSILMQNNYFLNCKGNKIALLVLQKISLETKRLSNTSTTNGLWRNLGITRISRDKIEKRVARPTSVQPENGFPPMKGTPPRLQVCNFCTTCPCLRGEFEAGKNQKQRCYCGLFGNRVGFMCLTCLLSIHAETD